MERLTVSGFAGLKKVVFEPKKITVLIGPQASGKSILAKLTYYFRSVWNEFLSQSDGLDVSIDDRIESAKADFRKYFPPGAWGRKVFSIQYEVNGFKIILRRSPSRGRPSEGLIFTLPDAIYTLVRDRQLSVDVAKKASKSARDRRVAVYGSWRDLQQKLKEMLGDGYYSGQLFIPASRAFFSNIENNVFSFISRSEKMLDPFIAQFGEYYSYLKMDLSEEMDIQADFSFLTRAMNGRLVIEKDQEFIVMSDGRKIPLSNLSSGQQELLPLVLSLAGPSWFLDGVASKALYIEEPEAHLFPEFQRLVLEQIVHALGKDDSFQNLIMTTHSPYLLSALNNQILASSIGRRTRGTRRARVEEIVPKKYWVSTNDVAAYAIGGGSAISIIDDETGLIDATYIDSVSTSIATIFDELLELI